MKPFSTVVRAAVCALVIVGAAPAVLAQTPLEMVKAYEAEREKLEQDVQARFEAIGATLETEMQTKRIAPEAAKAVRRQLDQRRRELRWLKSYESSSDGNAAVAMSAPLDKAKENFNAALKARDVFRTEKLRQVRDAVIEGVLSTWRKAERDEDLNDALELQREAERVLPPVEVAAQGPGSSPATLPWRMSETASGPLSAPVSVILQELSYLLSTSQRLLSLIRNDGDPRLIENTFKQLRPVGNSQWARIVSEAETDKWKMRFTDKAVAEVTALRAQVDRLIAKGATAKELQPIAEKLWPATLRMQALGGNAGPGSERDVLKAWVRTLERIESGDWEDVQRELNAVGGPPEWLSAEGRKGFYAKLGEADKGHAAAEKTARVDLEKEIRERLAKVKDGASALALAEELSIEQREGNESMRERLAGLQADLRRLAALWNAQPGTTSPLDVLSDSGSLHPWQADLRLLRSKVLRERIAQTSNSPELLAAPLDALPLETAIRKLGAALKEKQDWQRLHDLLATSRPGGDGRMGDQNDELRGVKAFLTGRNFEQAEQYGDAVQSYRAVMSCIGKLVPVEAAAERLKAIAREHPDAVSAASSPGASAQPVLRATGEVIW